MGTAYLPYPSTYVGKIDDDYEISGWTRSERASGSLSLFPYYQVDGPLETDTGNGILALHSCDLRRLPAGTWRKEPFDHIQALRGDVRIIHRIHLYLRFPERAALASARIKRLLCVGTDRVRVL